MKKEEVLWQAAKEAACEARSWREGVLSEDRSGRDMMISPAFGHHRNATSLPVRLLVLQRLNGSQGHVTGTSIRWLSTLPSDIYPLGHPLRLLSVGFPAQIRWNRLTQDLRRLVA